MCFGSCAQLITYYDLAEGIPHSVISTPPHVKEGTQSSICLLVLNGTVVLEDLH